MLATSEIPPATMTEDVVVADDDYITDEEELKDHNEAVFEDLENLEDDLVWVDSKASLRDTSMIGPS
ncbi:hypothetical protein KY289_016389 [Solanum tuberosum]|nr:hypothetical protein KY284_024930 [Solanum tuberosum]KAH0689031.1 hypothetical protein KY289_016389 [Solanum tuberosum]